MDNAPTVIFIKLMSINRRIEAMINVKTYRVRMSLINYHYSTQTIFCKDQKFWIGKLENSTVLI